ncbi:MAG TPA: formylglycine-generating enzyme family protein [Candidatus Acidoferrales bacterium]|nr:formylglycine-generating enzyme family protein [Candidatus Acidoferrales bacterium]
MTEPAHSQSISNAGFAVPEMVGIPEGWFLMGSETGQDNERPVHRVWIDAFDLAVCQVTNTDYARFIAAAAHRKPLYWDDPNFSHPEQPVVAPSWFDAVAYCDWLSRMTGQPYRLPTEAEWERAARGGIEQKPYPWGDEPPESLPNYASRWKTGPEPVGRAERNAYGLCDIGANVHEWCSDWFNADYYSVSPERNPPGPIDGKRHASRGGSWRHYTKVSRCAARSSIPPEFQYADYGFRVARDTRQGAGSGS